MKQFECAIEILDEEYINSLIVALVRQGYAPYYNDKKGAEGKGTVYFTVYESDLEEIKRYL